MPAHVVPGGYVPRHRTPAAARRSQPPHPRPEEDRRAKHVQRAAAVTVLIPVFTLISGIAGHPR